MNTSEQALDVISVGSALADVFVGSSGISVIDDQRSESGKALSVPLGAKLEAELLQHEVGGGAANTAVGFARLGLRTAILARVGADSQADRIRQNLEREHVDASGLIVDPERETGQSILLLAPQGDRTVLAYRGAGETFLVEELPESFIARARWLYVSSLGGDRQVLSRLFGLCHLHGLKLAWNPGNRELSYGLSVLTPLLQEVDVLLLNREEAARLTSLPHHQTEDILAQLLLRISQGVVVVTDGPAGAVAFDGTSIEHLAARNVPVLDTTGAGDAFGCGFVGGLMNDLPTKEALAFGLTNAESVIGHVGAQPGLLGVDAIARGRMVDLG